MPQKESVQDVPQRGKIKKFKTKYFRKQKSVRYRRDIIETSLLLVQS